MAVEQFDLVDETDRVIGVTDKPTAHATRQLHRVVAVYVCNDKGELYVQVHKASGGKLDHSVGGHVSRGESYAAAARREAQEELGIHQPLTHVTTFYSDEGRYLHTFGVFECVADRGWKFTPNEEVSEIIPMKLTDIQDMMQKAPKNLPAVS